MAHVAKITPLALKRIWRIRHAFRQFVDVLDHRPQPFREILGLIDVQLCAATIPIAAPGACNNQPVPLKPAVKHVKLALDPIREVPLFKCRLFAVALLYLFELRKLPLIYNLALPDVWRFWRDRLMMHDAVEMAARMPASVNDLKLSSGFGIHRL